MKIVDEASNIDNSVIRKLYSRLIKPKVKSGQIEIFTIKSKNFWYPYMKSENDTMLTTLLKEKSAKNEAI